MSWKHYLNRHNTDVIKEDLLTAFWDLKEAKENGADADYVSDLEWEISAMESALDEYEPGAYAEVERTFEAAKALSAIEKECI